MSQKQQHESNNV